MTVCVPIERLHSPGSTGRRSACRADRAGAQEVLLPSGQVAHEGWGRGPFDWAGAQEVYSNPTKWHRRGGAGGLAGELLAPQTSCPIREIADSTGSLVRLIEVDRSTTTSTWIMNSGPCWPEEHADRR